MTNHLQERMAEARAAAEAAAICKILNDLVLEPSTKRFVKRRAERIERWEQLAQVARAHAAGLSNINAPVPMPAPTEPGETTQAAVS